MKAKVEREIERIHRYERKWKIKTSPEKNKIIPIAQFKTSNIAVNRRELNKSKEGKVLALKIQSNGLMGHTSNIRNKANAVLTKLRRFIKLTPKLKLILVKSLLLPILEYPVIPLCTALLTQKRKHQVILNKALRFVNYNKDDRPLTANDLHLNYNTKPYNMAIHSKAKKIWETIRLTEPEHYNKLIHHFPTSHIWFPKMLTHRNQFIQEDRKH